MQLRAELLRLGLKATLGVAGMHACFGAIAVSAPGCVLVPDGCNSDGVAPIYHVRVRDKSSGAPICDAEVFVGVERAVVAEEKCLYFYAIPEHTETALIRAEHPGYLPATKEVSTDYTTDSCGKPNAPRNVELELEPSP